MYGSHWAENKQLLAESADVVLKRVNAHSAIVVFGLQVYSLDHIHPDQTLLGAAVRELSELTWRSSNTRVIWQRVHFERALLGDESEYICFLQRISCGQCGSLHKKHRHETFSSPTTVGSSSPFSFLPRCSLKVLQKSVRFLKSATFSSSQSYTWEHTHLTQEKPLDTEGQSLHCICH